MSLQPLFSRLGNSVLIGALALSGCTYFQRHAHPPGRVAEPSKYPHEQTGKASWYGPGFQGKRTASGETFDQDELTAGSRTLPLGTVVEVTNLKNRKKVKVRINDRGPWVRGRTIDLSRAAAARLGMVKTGVAPVRIKVKSKGHLHKRHRHIRHRRRAPTGGYFWPHR